jgi:hypothetical protein
MRSYVTAHVSAGAPSIDGKLDDPA